MHFTDGRPPQHSDPEDLTTLTIRARDGDHAQQRLLRTIDYLQVSDPNPYLRAFDLVDTPGLDSVFQTDSQNTLRFLGRTGDDIRAASAAHASKADALVVVFARGLAASEEELLADFVGPGLGSGPITTIAALTKIELSWPEHPDPMTEGYRLAERVMNAPGARGVLYDVRPVASLVAAAAATFTPEQYADLTELSTVDAATLEKRLRRGPYFAARPYEDLPIPAGRRAALLRRFGQYGIALACRLLREGVDTPDTMRTELTTRSGITEFKQLLVNHFGNRADLIKLRGSLDATFQLRDRINGQLSPRDRITLIDALTPLSALDHNEHAFQELDVLRHFYDGGLTFTPDDAVDLLRVTGEHGTSAADRLALPSTATVDELATAARRQLAAWAERDLDPAYAGRSRRAVQVLRRSYERLVARIDQIRVERQILS